MKNTGIYPGCVAMTFDDAKRMDTASKRAGWGLTIDNLKRIIRKHKKARECGDIRTMEMIEYRFEDCNFHTINDSIHDGLYDEALKDAER